MLKIRQYKQCDAERIASWVADETVFLKWGGKLFGDYPVSAETIDEKYSRNNGDCAEEDNFYPWIAVNDDYEPVGHFIMRYIHGDHRALRFGWVVMDPSRRGKGYGTEMLRAGLKYAFEFLGADRVTLGVFEHNDIAHNCYRKAGFVDTGEVICKEPWNVIEMEIRREDYLSGGAGRHRTVID